MSNNKNTKKDESAMGVVENRPFLAEYFLCLFWCHHFEFIQVALLDEEAS